MIKSITTMALAGLVALTITGCGGAIPTPAEEVLDERCHKAGELVPEWVCTPSLIEGATYSAVGVGTSSNESMKTQQAIGRARSELAKQMNTMVKTKLEDFMRATGSGDAETIDAVTTSVTKQTAKIDLSGSKKIKEFTTKSGKLFALVAIDETIVNNKVKDTVKAASSSKGNDDALWQQFQSKQAMDSLDKEFPTD
jgi:hypothetical protein